MSWTCFLAEPTGLDLRALRRYSTGEGCPANPAAYPRAYHDAQVRIEDCPHVELTRPVAWDHADPRWPSSCACGYRFAPSDAWQLVQEPLYGGAPDGQPFALRDAPVGAMWYTPWMVEDRWRPSDEVLAAGTDKGYLSRYYWQDWHGTRPPIMVQLPGKHMGWLVDAKANNGDGWKVTGSPPLLTAHPSIMTPSYHGWLNNGVLSDDLDGRSY